MELTVYGATTLCASCVNAPSSIETMEWLEAALKRKFNSEDLKIRYVDMNFPENEVDRLFTEKIKNDDYFYPLVVGNGQVLGEGNIRLKPIVRFLEEQGFTSI